MIEMGKKYQTRDGRAVRILCTDLKGCGAAVVIGLVMQPSGNEYVESWMSDGRVLPGEPTDGGSDLIPVPTKHEGWMLVSWSVSENCWLNGRIYNSLIEATTYVDRDRRLAHVIWED